MAARRRRSCLTVPGDDERKLAKAAGLDADEVILDLEDAVAADRKDDRARCVARALAELDWRAPTVAVRVNRGSADDLELVRTARPDVVVLPKVESPDELAGLPVPAEAQIETARGLVECERIAAAPGLEALVLGPGDLAASLGVPELTIGAGAHIEYALVRILVAARAFGLAAIDGPYRRPRRRGRAPRVSAQRSRSLGYDGKWCIHPAQVESATRSSRRPRPSSSARGGSSRSKASRASTARWSTRRTGAWPRRSSPASGDRAALRSRIGDRDLVVELHLALKMTLGGTLAWWLAVELGARRPIFAALVPLVAMTGDPFAAVSVSLGASSASSSASASALSSCTWRWARRCGSRSCS